MKEKTNAMISLPTQIFDPIPHALMTHIWQNQNDLHPPNITSQRKYHLPNKMNTNKIAPSMFHQLAFGHLPLGELNPIQMI